MHQDNAEIYGGICYKQKKFKNVTYWFLGEIEL